MTSTACILTFVAQTAVHAGGDTSDGAIDLPIQREAHTGWPVVFSSGVKGALRENAERAAADDQAKVDVLAIYGSDNAGRTGDDADTDDEPQTFEGALAIGDLQLLLLPVRSLTTRCKFVTSPWVLERYAQTRARLGLSAAPPVPPVPEAANEAWSATTGPAQVFLEEFLIEGQPHAALAPWVQHLANSTGWDVQRLERDVLVVDDDTFAWLCVHATPKATHVALTEEKVVKAGALWIEETLAPSTVLFTPLLAMRSRHPDCAMPAADVLKKALSPLHTTPYLRVGGNETVGQGWGKVIIEPAGAAP